jgi:hypothetical protein
MRFADDQKHEFGSRIRAYRGAQRADEEILIVR